MILLDDNVIVTSEIVHTSAPIISSLPPVFRIPVKEALAFVYMKSK